MDNLSNELLLIIVSYLNPSDVIQFCNTCSKYKCICQDENFWQFYLRERYSVDIKRPDKNWRETAMSVENILDKIFDRGNIISVLGLNYIIPRYSEDIILMAIAEINFRNQIMGFNDWEHSNKIVITPHEDAWLVRSVNFPETITDSNYNRFMEYIFDIIERNTFYHTPKGLTVLPYDKDLAIAIINNHPYFDSQLADNIADNIYAYERGVYRSL